MRNTTAHVECDAACPANALVIVVKNTMSLAFCGHHFALNEALLGVTGWLVYVDERASLTPAA